MRFTALLLLLLFTLTAISSCSPRRDAYGMMSDFVSSYSVSGVVYYSTCEEGNAGYLDSDVFGKIYMTATPPPGEYAIMLNCHASYGAECGVFVCRDSAGALYAVELCEERLRLLRSGDRGLLIRSGDTVFYSTLSDKGRAEQIWRGILRSYR